MTSRQGFISERYFPWLFVIRNGFRVKRLNLEVCWQLPVTPPTWRGVFLSKTRHPIIAAGYNNDLSSWCHPNWPIAVWFERSIWKSTLVSFVWGVDWLNLTVCSRLKIRKWRVRADQLAIYTFHWRNIHSNKQDIKSNHTKWLTYDLQFQSVMYSQRFLRILTQINCMSNL